MKKKSKFWKIYKIMILVMLILSIVVWGILWCFLDSYEKSTPEKLIDKVLYMFNSKDTNSLSKYIKIPNEDIYDSKDISNILKDELNSKYTYRKKNGSSEKNPKYSIIDKERKEIAIISLNLKGKSGIFKMKSWEVEGISNIIDDTNDIEVIIPDGSKLYVNNKFINEDKIVDKEVVFTKLINVKDLVEVPFGVKYTLKNIINNTKVECEYLGKKIELINQDNKYDFIYPSDQEYINVAKSRMDGFVDSYTRYVAAEVGFGSVTPYLLSNTKVYSFLSKIASTNKWSGDHSRSEISEIEYSNVQVYNENLFSVDVKYHYSFSVGTNKKDFDSTLTLYMVNKNNNWYVGDMTT